MQKKFSQILNQTLNIHSPTKKGIVWGTGVHVAATHQTSQHQTLKSQIQMLGPYALMCVGRGGGLHYMLFQYTCEVNETSYL